MCDEPFISGFDRIGKNWIDDHYTWKKEPSKQLLQIKPDYSMKIQKKCDMKYGNRMDLTLGNDQVKIAKSVENMSTEDVFSATDCSFDSCEISLNSDHSISPEISHEHIPNIFKLNSQAVPTSLNSSSCGFRTYLSKGQSRRKFCFYCYDMEYRNCVLRNEGVPTVNQAGIWKSHTTYDSKGRLTCPLLHFFQRSPSDIYNITRATRLDQNCSAATSCSAAANCFAGRVLDRRESKNRFKY